MAEKTRTTLYLIKSHNNHVIKQAELTGQSKNAVIAALINADMKKVKK
jgi:hypothetical protein